MSSSRKKQPQGQAIRSVVSKIGLVLIVSGFVAFVVAGVAGFVCQSTEWNLRNAEEAARNTRMLNLANRLSGKVEQLDVPQEKVEDLKRCLEDWKNVAFVAFCVSGALLALGALCMLTTEPRAACSSA